MIVGRALSHVKTHNWLAVVVDFSIVVIGVFMGIQFNNWNEDRITRRSVDIYHQRLAEDLRAEESSWAQLIGYYQGVKRHGEAALAALNASPGGLGGPFLIDAYQATQIITPAPYRSTFDELLAVGAINSIPDTSLRKRIAAYYRNMESTRGVLETRTTYRQTLRSAMPHAAQTLIRSECGDQYNLSEDNTLDFALPVSCSIELEPDDMTAAAMQVHGTPGLSSDLTAHLADLETKIGLARLGLFQSGATAEYIEGQLKERQEAEEKETLSILGLD
jgi:hypothetical protein